MREPKPRLVRLTKTVFARIEGKGAAFMRTGVPGDPRVPTLMAHVDFSRRPTKADLLEMLDEIDPSHAVRMADIAAERR